MFLLQLTKAHTKENKNQLDVFFRTLRIKKLGQRWENDYHSHLLSELSFG